MAYLQTLPEYKLFHARLQGVAGSSSGSVAALGVCVDCDFCTLTKESLSFGITDAAPDLSVANLFERFGLDSGTTLRQAIICSMESMGLSQKMTFHGLHKLTSKEFVVVATNLNSRTATYFSHKTFPHLPILDALHMSMAVPVVFEPVSFGGSMYVDGGMTQNVPFRAFPDEKPLLLYMDTSSSSKLVSLREYATSLLSCSLSAHQEHVAEYGRHNPTRVFMFSEGRLDEAVNFCATPEYIIHQSRKGYGMAVSLCDEDVLRVVTLLVICCVAYA
tara:strand:+ start:1353 stop:2177 length:825 start_codon:yes stop_codon:yes gene_type:complete